MTTTTTTILWGWLSCTLVSACSGGDEDTAGLVTASSSSSMSTTASTNSATTSDSVTSTTSGTSGTATESSTTSTGTTAGATTCSFVDCNTTDSCSEVPGWPGVRCTPLPDCDLWDDDCPQGQKCMPWANDGGSSWNATKCSPIDPMPGKPGDPCTVEGSGVSGIDSCEKGAMCWDVDAETMMGYCVGFCDGSPEDSSCAEPNSFCTFSGVLILCLPGCDPLMQDCPNGDLCIDYGGKGFFCVLDASGEEGQYGDPCEFLNVCDPGLVCLNPEFVPECQAGGCCSPYCELDVDYETIPAPAPNCPDPKMSCLNWFEAGMAPPGKEKVGVCGVAL